MYKIMKSTDTGLDELEIDRLEKENLKNFDTTTRLIKIISISPEEIIFCVAGTKNYNDEEFVSKLNEFINSQAIAKVVIIVINTIKTWLIK